MMKTKTFFLVMWLLLPMSIIAQVNTVVVNMKDGSTTMFLFSDGPVLSYANNNLNITTKSKDVSISLSDIINVTFEDCSEPSVTTSISLIDHTGNSILFSKPSQGTFIQVFTNDGTLVCSKKTDNEGNINLNLEELPKGLLIINTHKSTFKITNK